jgi:hypothetical protein
MQSAVTAAASAAPAQKRALADRVRLREQAAVARGLQGHCGQQCGEGYRNDRCRKASAAERASTLETQGRGSQSDNGSRGHARRSHQQTAVGRTGRGGAGRMVPADPATHRRPAPSPGALPRSSHGHVWPAPPPVARMGTSGRRRLRARSGLAHAAHAAGAPGTTGASCKRAHAPARRSALRRVCGGVVCSSRSGVDGPAAAHASLSPLPGASCNKAFVQDSKASTPLKKQKQTSGPFFPFFPTVELRRRESARVPHDAGTHLAGGGVLARGAIHTLCLVASSLGG